MSSVDLGVTKGDSQRLATSPIEESSRIKTNLLVGVVALACRVAVALPAMADPRRFYVTPDSFEYDQLALNLLHGHGYSLALTLPYLPDIRRTPVYPLVLAAIYAVVGHEPRVAIVVNVALGVLACVLTAALGSQIFGANVGTVAGLFLATDPTSVAYSLTLMTETLFSVLTILCALALVQALYDPARQGVPGAAIIAAVWCGIAILTRPIALLLPFVLGPALALLRPAPRRVRFFGLTVVTLLALVFPLAWTVRNYLVAGLAQPTSVIAINAYYHRAVPLQAQARGAPRSEEETSDGQSPASAIPPEDSAGRLREMESSALGIIRADPIGYAQLQLSGLASLLGPDRAILPQLVGNAPSVVDGSGARPARRTLGAGVLIGEKLQLVAVYVFAAVAIGLGLASSTKRSIIALLLAFIFYFLVMSGPEAYARFRVPVMPFIAVLAAAGASTCWGVLHPFIVPRDAA